MSTSLFSASSGVSRQRWLVLALLLIFFGLSIQYTFKALENRSAFLRWSPQIQDLDDGVNIYRTYEYPNPPIMALLLRPLVALPSVVGALGWFYLKVGMTLLALVWVFRLVGTAEQPVPFWAQVLTVLLSLRPILGDLSHGNVNLFILFLVIGSLYAFHHGRDLTAGILLGLAIACKVTPALFLPYFLWKRAWTAVAGSVLGLILFLFVVPSAFLGWQQNSVQLTSWFQQMVVPYTIKGEVTSEHHNQSLPGVVYRLTTANPSFVKYIDRQRTPAEFHNLISLEPWAANLIVKGCMAVFALLVVWSCRTPTTPRTGWRLAAEFSLVLLGMLLFSERTWKHHCVTLVLPFAVLCYYLATAAMSWRLRAHLIGSLTAVVLLMLSTSGTSNSRFADLTLVYGAWTWACVILLAALVVILRRPSPAPGG